MTEVVLQICKQRQFQLHALSKEVLHVISNG